MAELYLSGLEQIARLPIESAKLQVMLVQPSYRFDARHDVVDNETPASPRAHELTVAGYARVPLRGARLARDDARGRVYLDAEDVDFGSLEPGERVGGAVLVWNMGSDRLSPLVAFYAQGRVATTGGPVTMVWAAAELGRVLHLSLQ